MLMDVYNCFLFFYKHLGLLVLVLVLVFVLDLRQTNIFNGNIRRRGSIGTVIRP